MSFRPLRLDVRPQRGRQLVGAPVGEAVEPDVADGAVGVVAAHDLLLLDDVAGDLQRERLRVAALHGQRRRRCPWGRGSARGPRRRSGRRATTPSVARTRSPARRPAFSAGDPAERRDDDEPAVRAQRRAALRPVGGLGRDLRADALELAADALEGVVVLLRGQVRGVRVAERLDHAADGALDERVAVDLAAGVALVDRVVRVPERAGTPRPR